RKRGRSSLSRTTWARSSRAARGSSGWRPARSCGTATTSRASSTSTWPRPAASPATASARGCYLPPGGEIPGAWLALRALEGQAHDGAALLAGLGDDRAVLGDCQPPDDVEADADAAEAAAVARLALHEPLEDPLVVAWGDADALIFDVHLDQRAHGAAAHRDSPAGWRVLEGVLEQLADDDVRGHRVAVGERQVVGHVGDDLVL